MTAPRRRGAVRLAALLAVSGAIAGCGPKPYVRAGFLEHPPRRLAVLPFVITYPYDLAESQAIPESHAVGRDIFRKTFADALTPYGYQDVRPADVDQALAAAWGPVGEEGWRAASPRELGEALAADALVYGEISHIMHVATPLYTESSLEATLRMVDAASGEVLWRMRVRSGERGGALVKKGQVVDFVKDQARSAHPEVKFLRVADQAVRRALKGFPNPPLGAEQRASRWDAGKPSKALRLAVLPLAVGHERMRKGAERLRYDLTASLQASPFDVLELQRVDEALKGHGWKEGEPLPADLSLPQLAQALGADAFLRGTVTAWGRTYLIVQSWVKAGMELELVDAKSGDAVWSGKDTDTRQAGILKGPTGYKSLAMAPITGLKTSHLERVANHLAREMAEEMSQSPAVQTYVSDRTR